ncbi:MAG: ATP-binding protein [Spirochaetales bacterium]|uniref:ATP-binding protein n=1 Tax=Candidatus Thalassospirochaeta sargassi TaxID=3119039 RepID=A0AAJ1ILZ5_9SPIO|nr:ATP-binding protein [Spirochaetales bacterium]
MKIAVASGKGGTGKTTLSINLTNYISGMEDFPAAILADLDVEEPNSGLFIDGETIFKEEKYKYIPEWDSEKCTNCGLCDRVCNFNALLKMGKTVMVLPELCHSCYACSELCPAAALPMKPQRMGGLKEIQAPGFRFIESRLDIGQEQAVPLIAQSIEHIEKKYENKELVVIDSPPGTSCPVIEVAKNSDFIILVTEPTPFGLHDLSLAVDTMREINRDFAVVINRWGIGNDEVVKYCDDNNIEIIARLPNMRRIAEIYSEGKLIYPEVPEFKAELYKIAVFLKKKLEGTV